MHLPMASPRLYASTSFLCLADPLRLQRHEQRAPRLRHELCAHELRHELRSELRHELYAHELRHELRQELRHGLHHEQRHELYGQECHGQGLHGYEPRHALRHEL